MKKLAIIAFLSCSLTLSVKAETLSIQQCLDMAKTNNRELQNAALEIQTAISLKKEAYTRFFPLVSANVMAFRAFDDILKPTGTYPQELAILGEINPAFAELASYAGKPYSFASLNRGYVASVSAMEPIYTGGKITTANRLADIQKVCNELQRSLKEKDVLQKVTENFWHIASLRYNLRTIEAAEKQIAEVYRNVNNFVNNGVTTRNALLKVKLRQQELASNRLKLENNEHILLMLLAQQIGAPVLDFNISVADESSPVSLPQQAPLEAADNREEMQLAFNNITAKQLQIRMERSKMLPTFAVGVMGYNAGFWNVESIIDNHLSNGLALATLSVPISEWWCSSHAVRRAKIKVQQAKNDFLDAQEKLRIDNEVAWCNLTEAHKQISIARSSVDEAEENLRISMNRYKAGVETINDLLDAETLNRKAHAQLSSAIADYNIRLADYLRKTK